MTAVTNAGAATVTVTEVLMLPKLAAMVVVPWDTAVNIPVELTVPTAVVEELQVTGLVKSLVLPSA